ncbi:hypothetical protein MC378_10285 [Polaribacter sp. MSW13]|uniref:Uncharacterized protein n=1 Tax=Polaribacter marinus TaxID=2916838 RepID=A0A9X1VRP7_9FLAO|nr:hypothetical protein [Polaribacter marinus]MCI2229555.1 hypothetical protein [Polaribacter marinus]
MAKFTVTQLEKRVADLNTEMMKHGERHENYKQWQSSRNYYVNKLTEMDEYDLQTIEI